MTSIHGHVESHASSRCPADSSFERPLAARRTALAQSRMMDCRFCAFECGVDRTRGPAGVCRSDSSPRVFHEGIEWAGETALVPTYVVSFSGCNFACPFCLTGAESQDGSAGIPLDARSIAARVRQAAPLLRSVTILGGEPSIHLPGALTLAARLPASLPLVWKTNAYASRGGLRLLRGIPDLILADYKFGNDECAIRLAGTPDYGRVVRSNLRWAVRTSSLIVRHLLMPGHLSCCLEPILEWMAGELPTTPFSLMTGFLPVFRSAEVAGLCRTNRSAEVEEARRRTLARGLRLAEWASVPVSQERSSCPDDTLWIDREGRICVDSASASLLGVLQKINVAPIVAG